MSDSERSSFKRHCRHHFQHNESSSSGTVEINADSHFASTTSTTMSSTGCFRNDPHGISEEAQVTNDIKRQRRSHVDLSKIEVVSFDLDDTLWHCEPVINKAETAMRSFLLSKGLQNMHDELLHPKLGEYQKTVIAENPTKAHDVTFLRKTVIKLAASRSNITDERVCEEAFESFHHARTFHVSEHIFPGAVEALQRMRNLGLRIGTITNGNAVVPKIPEIAPYVEHHVNPEMAGAAKPSKEPFDTLRKLFGDVPADRILHVGDSFETDVCGALSAGMKACWVTVDTQGKEKDEVLVVSHVSELADMFERDFARRTTSSVVDGAPDEEQAAQ